MDISWGSVGPVPVAWEAAAGPRITSIGFRVGRADERLSRAGLTHLAEHLALWGLGDVLYDYNAWVDGTTTWFVMRGADQESVDFVAHLRNRLLHLPLERLKAESGVLRAEASRR